MVTCNGAKPLRSRSSVSQRFGIEDECSALSADLPLLEEHRGLIACHLSEEQRKSRAFRPWPGGSAQP